MRSRMWSWTTCGLAGAVLAGPVLGCGTDAPTSGACANENIDHNAVLRVSDAAGNAAGIAYDIDVVALQPGGAREFSFRIRNDAQAVSGRPLVVKAVALQETDGDGKPVSAPAFACVAHDGKPCAPAGFPAVIPAGFDPKCAPAGALTQVNFSVRYTRPAGSDLRKYKVAITFSGDVKQGDTPWTATFATRLGSPKLDCTPSTTDFGKVGLAQGATATVLCANDGKGAAVLSAATMLGSLPLQAQLGPYTIAKGADLPAGKTVEIAAGTALEIPVVFKNLASEEKAQAILRLTTNEPGKEKVDLSFVVNTTGPCVKFVPPGPIDFGVVPVGVPQPREVQIQACGTEDLAITDVAVAEGVDQGFAVSFASTCFNGKPPSAAHPVVVPKGATCSLGVSYTAPQLGASSKGKIAVTSNAGIAAFALQGKAAATVQCPKACMAVKLATGGSLSGDVLPQSKLKFDAGCSVPGSSGQPIAKYKWTLQQPAGSYATFQPSANVKTPQLQPNIAGKYVVTLEIADAFDTPGCGPTSYELNVISDDKLYVELTWDTPADPDKTDETDPATGSKPAGSDLDVHLAHADAPDEPGQPDLDKNGEPDPWYAPCLDCSVWNVVGKWGKSDDFDDDAALDRDDKDGWGPEIIAVHVPQPNLPYFVGVYYFSNNGFGKSTPTIKVYLDGKLHTAKTGPTMDMQDMWCAGVATWSPASFKPCKGSDSKGDLWTKKYPLQPNKNLKCP
ncbi:MAG: choice-of-anchor D domain-containing protein [Deltaproteobacteria bacterium]|nr:choice-of-anchor D domain-containing protein [Deltaproteobacteria bacterium]